MNMKICNCDELEEQLRGDLFHAQKQFIVAYGRLKELKQWFTQKGFESDGTITLAEARQIAAEAHQKYWRVLRSFSRFVLREGIKQSV